ncbi:MAG: aspartyl/asparaginyl beta-hydroxylase domain-containing protein [Solirubrobacteraceae bacterium]
MTATELIGFLRSAGASAQPHAGGRTLLEHLVGTYEIVRRWGQPEVLQQAALLHSVYGTDVYHEQLLLGSRRDEVVGIAGTQAERLAYLFGATPRELVFGGTHIWARGVSALASAATDEPTRDELDQLLLLHIANLAEQAQAEDGSPGRWLVRLRDLAELLIDSETVTLPLFVAELAAFSESDESTCRRAYGDGVGEAEDLEAKASRLALTAATCSVVAEPCIWLAYLSHARGDESAARSWARGGRRRLLALGTAWDKRLTFEQWLRLAELLDQPTGQVLQGAVAPITDPRALFDEAQGHSVPAAVLEFAIETGEKIKPSDSRAGEARFHRYTESFTSASGQPLRGVYPDLSSQPWYDPQDFPLVKYLESNFEAIRDEILALEPSRFHRESERIKRAGEWDVAFLYERGRRRGEVCDACPVTTRGIESDSTMRTVTGLIYASRMRAGTHIQAHRGPTNLRLRCHLGINVPDGDCAIRVGEQTRHWSEGRCLVFDDFFEHEAWNHTDEDRIVLIVDLWHPGLSATEVRLLKGLHAYAYAYATQLDRYWASNAAAMRTSSPGAEPAGSD